MNKLEEYKREHCLMYGKKSVWLIRFKDKNCSDEFISFFDEEQYPIFDRVILDHADHEGFEIQVVEVMASNLQNLSNVRGKKE
jgi:hypothetical protein